MIWRRGRKTQGELPSVTESCCFPFWWLAFQTLLPPWSRAHPLTAALLQLILYLPLRFSSLWSILWATVRLVLLKAPLSECYTSLKNPSLTLFIYRTKSKLLRPAIKTLFHAMPPPYQPNPIFTYFLKLYFCPAKISFSFSWPHMLTPSSVSVFHVSLLFLCIKQCTSAPI